MESEKVKEIKKALECCRHSIKDGCKDCPYHNPNEDCQEFLIWNMEDYINELESENESLKKDNELLRNAKVVYENVDYCYEDLKKAEKRIAELEKEKTCIWEEWTDGDHSIWCCSNCKEDFCFIEGDVYENNYGYCPHCGAKITALKEMQEEQIDETLKEFCQETQQKEREND